MLARAGHLPYEQGFLFILQNEEKPLSNLGNLPFFSPSKLPHFSTPTMNEASFQTYCSSSVHYFSGEEQITTRHAEEEHHLRRAISTDCPTYVHLAVNVEHHWAAIQITITPFILQTLPGQIFYSSTYRYTLCCESAKPSVIWQTVQRTYDIHYRPSQWDFSNNF